MIYNLYKYLKTEFPTEKFYINNKSVQSGGTQVNERMSIIIEQPGTITPWFHLQSVNIQVLSRDKDTPGARDLSYKIFNLLLSEAEFGKILPAETVNGVTFPEIQIAQISPISQPQSLGFNQDRLAEFTANYKFTFRR